MKINFTFSPGHKSNYFPKLLKKYLFLTMLLFTSVTFSQTATAPAAGDGSSGDPYQIASLENLYWIAATDAVVASPNRATRWTKHYIQTADIDASATSGWDDGAGFSPIGSSPRFSGSYNGNGYKISSLNINQPTTNFIGLFGYTYGAELKNINLEDANIIGQTFVGGLVGLAVSSTTIDNCSSNASVTGTDRVGALVGNGTELTITNSHSSGIVNGTAGTYAGGLVGLFLGPPNTVTNCNSTASVSGGSQGAGGLVGRCDETTISNSYSTGTVSGTGNYYGGLVGTMNNLSSVINNSYSTGTVSGSGLYYGGLVGYLDGTVTNSYSTGSVSGSGLIGGLVGGGTVTVTNSFWDTETSGRPTSGGGTGKTTAQMKTQSTFTDAGWDFIVETDNGTNDYWEMNTGFNSGYPILSWQSVEVPTITTTPTIVSNSNIGFTAQSGSVSLSFVAKNSTPGNLPNGSVTIGKYWEVSDVTGGSIKLRLYYLPSQTASFTGTPKIYHYDGSSWVLLPTEAEVIDGLKRYVETTNYYSSFSPVIVGDELSPLPVELTSFTAQLSNENVLLTWQTATEVNNYGFEIQRKANLRGLDFANVDNLEGFTSVGFVAGHGNSNSPVEYSFLDKTVTNGKYSYRLKQIDNDGNFSYNDVVEVELNNIPTEYSLYQNYPNPFNPTTTMKFGLPKDGMVTLEVYNLIGEKVAALINQELTAGYHTIDFNGSRLSSGIYLYKITSSEFTSTKKFVLMK